MRVPTLIRWPGQIEPGVVMELGTTLDLMPTFCKLADIELPADRVYDGYDLSPLLFGTGESVRDVVWYYNGTEVYAVRKGDYKAHFITQLEYGTKTAHFVTKPESDVEIRRTVLDTPLLFNLNIDPTERYNIAADHPEIIEDIRRLKEEHLSSVKPVENQLEK